MFQAYIDDSHKEGVSSYVLAGYISDTKRWMRFIRDWDRLLGTHSEYYGKIERFKMSEMTTPHGLERAGHFYSVIEDYAHVAVSSVVDADALVRVVRSYPWPKGYDTERWENPYYVSFQGIISMIAEHQEKFGITTPIDFIFDEQGELGPCGNAWERLKRSADPKVQRLLGDRPIGRSDETMLPLQAADLWAWWVRRWEETGVGDRGPQQLLFPWKHQSKPTLRFGMRWDETELRRKFDSVYRLVIARSRQ